MIQAGSVVELYVPRDKETEKPKGYAFAEYETEEIANYAVRLFSGLVTLYNRTLKFAVCSHCLICSSSFLPLLPAESSFSDFPRILHCQKTLSVCLPYSLCPSFQVGLVLSSNVNSTSSWSDMTTDGIRDQYDH